MTCGAVQIEHVVKPAQHQHMCMQNSIAPTTVCLADLLEMCFDLSGVLSALQAKPSKPTRQQGELGGARKFKQSLRQGRKGTEGSRTPLKSQPSSQVVSGVSELTEAPSTQGDAAHSGGVPEAAVADVPTDCDGSMSAVSATSSICHVGDQQQQAGQSPQHDRQPEEQRAQQEHWLKACDVAAWALYQSIHLMIMAPWRGNMAM
jgi:hypothetical protein